MAPKRRARSISNLRQLAFALIPAVVATVLVVGAMAVRMTTPIELDVLVRSVTVTVAGQEPVLLLNNSTVFSSFSVEECGSVSFPRLSIAPPEGAPLLSAGAVTFSCDNSVPGARVLVRGSDAAAGAQDELGSIGRILAEPGDRVRLGLTSLNPPEIRVETSRRTSFDVSLKADMPFEIVTSFVRAEGVAAADDPDGLADYRANFAGAGTERLARIDSGPSLNMVVRPAQREGAELFRANVAIPIESVSLFERDPVNNTFVSTAINGTLNYAGRPASESVQIEAEEDVRLRSASGFRLTRLRLDGKTQGIWLRLEGDAEELSRDGDDYRLTLFDQIVSDRNRSILAIIAVVASQLVWLRKFLWPASK